MDRYIGIDAHVGSCTVAVMGPTGRHLREERVDTDAQALRRVVGGIGGRRHLCIEEGMVSEWLYELLEPLVEELVVVQPRGSRANKSDALDAWARAEEVRVRAKTCRVFKAPGRHRSLREAVRTYDVVVKDQTRIKQRLRALYGSRGVLSSGAAIYDPCKRGSWLTKLPRGYRRRAEMLSEELDRVAQVREETESWAVEEARRSPDGRLLMTVPGLSTIRASQVVAHVVTPYRFRTKRQFWGYCGLGVVVRSSSDWVRTVQGMWQRRVYAPTKVPKEPVVDDSIG